MSGLFCVTSCRTRECLPCAAVQLSQRTLRLAQFADANSATHKVLINSGKTLTISDAMSSGASIGVTTGNTNYPVVFSNAYETDYKDYFFSDAGKTINYNSNKQLKIGKGAAHEHTGGTATCTAKAVCEICNQEYGEKDRREVSEIRRDLHRTGGVLQILRHLRRKGNGNLCIRHGRP